ncbi:hypothetical protein [Aneurinibacillus migulanus]|nr:hypothetical protein [Aneurinibacillus migulanus]
MIHRQILMVRSKKRRKGGCALRSSRRNVSFSDRSRPPPFLLFG